MAHSPHSRLWQKHCLKTCFPPAAPNVAAAEQSIPPSILNTHRLTMLRNGTKLAKCTSPISSWSKCPTQIRTPTERGRSGLARLATCTAFWAPLAKLYRHNTTTMHLGLMKYGRLSLSTRPKMSKRILILSIRPARTCETTATCNCRITHPLLPTIAPGSNAALHLGARRRMCPPSIKVEVST